ncbi:GNAT family protein [Streptomyces sp. SL13]|uniref:GNAT family protein n=1 Tax=Streptantibioticus silvisoli TaxID=2705255 RepID=A0AA90H5X1_9ACTN|nr:GNAT family protein [Streptantibioticus silvisoli]MDI5966783.1 GNAT family protein [Streptantibioticus silvisoli]MDI5971209.1 GNAT family protein [Streptantibioticus silvisoli]
MHPVDIAGPRLQLREFTDEDAAAVLAIYGDAEATRHLSFAPRTPRQVEEIVARSIASAAARPRSEYAVAVTRAGAAADVVGFARLALDPHQQRAATIGFALRPDTWGAGLGTETVHLLCALAFDELGLHRLWAARAPLNTASARTLLRAGMTQEGRIREHVFVNGAWRDSVTYSVLEDEWSGPAGRGA